MFGMGHVYIHDPTLNLLYHTILNNTWGSENTYLSLGEHHISK